MDHPVPVPQLQELFEILAAPNSPVSVRTLRHRHLRSVATRTNRCFLRSLRLVGALLRVNEAAPCIPRRWPTLAHIEDFPEFGPVMHSDLLLHAAGEIRSSLCSKRFVLLRSEERRVGK